METTKIKIEALIAADLQKVWDCYTQPNHITQWNFATDSWCCPKAENDLRPGGKYSARMEAKDGSFGFDFEAIYDELIPLKKIAYTLTDGRKVNTSFEITDGQCKISTIFDAETVNSIELQKQGWQAILDNFKKYTESTSF
ncbi:MAG: SRPBCC family protein [Saprospiraceae bacterium]|nr:SRPBCC family protein [Saprospiraceae bacterium]